MTGTPEKDVGHLRTYVDEQIGVALDDHAQTDGATASPSVYTITLHPDRVTFEFHGPSGYGPILSVALVLLIVGIFAWIGLCHTIERALSGIAEWSLRRSRKRRAVAMGDSS